MESKTPTVPAEVVTNLMDTVSSVIKFFIDRLTHKQWRQLKLGAPDYATKLMLVEMVLDIILSVLTILEACAEDVQLLASEESIHSTLSDCLRQSLDGLLGTPDQVSSTSSNQFVNLLSKEVAENVNSALCPSSLRSRGSFILERITPPNVIDAIVNSGCRMFRNFADKAKIMCKARSGSSKREDLEEVCQDPDNVASEGSFMRATSNVAQNLIRRKVRDLIEPLFDSKSLDYQLLLNKTSEEIQEIASVIEENLKIHPKPQTKFSNLQETVRRKLKKFFSLTVFKALIQRKFSQTRGNFGRGAKKSESLEKLLSRISSPLPNAEQQEENELSGSSAHNSGSMKTLLDSLIPLFPSDELQVGDELSELSAEKNESMEALFGSISSLLPYDAEQEENAQGSYAESIKSVQSLEEFVEDILPLLPTDERQEGKKLSDTGAENNESLESLNTLVDSILSMISPEEQEEGNEFQGSGAEESNSSETLLESILSVLQSDQQQEGNELSVTKTLRDISNGKVIKFASALTDLLYEHSTDDMFTTAVLREGLAPRTKAESFLYADIQKKVWMFLMIMSWWEKTQGDTHSKMVTLA